MRTGRLLCNLVIMFLKCCVLLFLLGISLELIIGEETTNVPSGNKVIKLPETKLDTKPTNDAVSGKLEMSLEIFRQEMNEQIKVIRNATMFLLTAISARANECQGIRDSASKIRILHSALALQDPDIKINIPEEYVKMHEEILEFIEEPELPDNMVDPEHKTKLSSKYTASSSFPTSHLTTTSSTTTSTPTESPNPPKQMPCGYVSEDYPDIPPIKCPPPLALPGFETEDVIETTTHKQNKYYITEQTNIEPHETILSPAVEGYYADTSTRSSNQLMEAKSRETYAVRSTFVCPEGSKKVGHECFSLHLDQQLNWTNARAFCRSQGGDLAEPDLQNNKLPRFLLKAWPSLRESEYWTLWVGATDLEMEGVWHWVTGGILDLKSSSRWDLVEPPDQGDTQDCLAMILWVPGRWRRWDLLDDPCELEWLVFCEYSPIYYGRIT